MKKLKRLRLGDKIAIVSPASPTSLEEVEGMRKLIESYGFRTKMGRSPYEKRGYLSGSDEIRARDINEMFKDPEVDAIFCARGGYGSPRILDLLDYELIGRNPKIFLGYSDITALHLALNQLAGFFSFHGPMGTSDMIHDFSEESRDSLFNSLMEPNQAGILKNPAGKKLKSLVGGRARGRLTGGNLSLIADTLATDFQIDARGKLLFLEEVGEEPRKIDRMLNQLRLAGILDQAQAIILGSFKDCQAKRKDSLSLMEVFEDYFMGLKKPVVYNLQAGHCQPSLTLIMGAEHILDADRGFLQLAEGCII